MVYLHQKHWNYSFYTMHYPLYELNFTNLASVQFENDITISSINVIISAFIFKFCNIIKI